MTAVQKCPACGAPGMAGAPPGVCPCCELRGALAATAHPTDQPLPGLSGPSEIARGLANGNRPCHLGDYELIEEIARGGMGIVYRARQRSLDRVVAIKLLPFSSLTSAEYIKRFHAEAAAAAALQHPNIVSVHEVGVSQGQHYLVMNFVKGPPLSRLVANGPLPAKPAATYIQTIAEAVHYAHDKGILHRDLKPSNVLIDENNQPQVTDFGLAKRLDSKSNLTQTGQAIGSPGYMPPEQAAGEHLKVTRHSDVYGLGAMLYHLLTGRPPFQAATLTEAIRQVLNTEPVPLRLLNPSVPRDLETICLKCLEKEPERRYPTAAAVAQELGRFRNGEPIQARPVGRIVKTWCWCRRKPLLASLCATTVLALVGGLLLALAGFAAARQESRAALRSAQTSNRVAELLRELLATAAPASGQGKDFTVKDMLDNFSANLEQRLAREPEVEALVRTALASTYLERYDSATAWTHLSRALALIGTRFPEDSLEAAIVWQTVGQYYNLNEQGNQAWFYFAKAYPIFQNKLPPDDFRLPLIKTQFAVCHRDAGDFPAAYRLLTEVAAATGQKAGDRDSDLLRANALRFLAGMFRAERKFSKARETIAAWRQAVARHYPPNHQLFLLAGFQEALLFRDQARLSNSAPFLARAIQEFEKILQVQSQSLPKDHVDTIETLHELAVTHGHAGHTNEAVRLIREAYEAAHRKVGPDHALTRKVLAAMREIPQKTARPELKAILQNNSKEASP